MPTPTWAARLLARRRRAELTIGPRAAWHRSTTERCALPPDRRAAPFCCWNRAGSAGVMLSCRADCTGSTQAQTPRVAAPASSANTAAALNPAANLRIGGPAPLAPRS
eukprot:4790269-Prymnesium_polylepis.1